MQTTSGPQSVHSTKQRPKPPGPLTHYGGGIQSALGAALPNGSLRLSGPFRYHLGWADRQGRFLDVPQDPGKAVRPALCLFACQALGGAWQRAMPAALALELVHNFSLVHDDIQDGDEVRRHKPTVWYVWGQPKALAVGNAMHATAYQTALALVQRGVTDATALRCSQLLVESSLSMIKGQVQDLQFEDSLDIGIDAYLGMIKLKTGALIACALRMGAILATENDAHVSAFTEYGRSLGRMFQIRDDVLGIWGDEKTTGKAGRSSDNDIRRKKKSFPIVLALQNADGPDRRRLEHIYGKQTLDQQDVDQVLDILEAVGAQESAQYMINREATLAMDALASVPISGWAGEEAQSLVDFLVSREY